MCTVPPSVEANVFTRWGNSSCGDNDVLLYTGYAASGKFSHDGAGSNVLCMHGNPTWDAATVYVSRTTS